MPKISSFSYKVIYVYTIPDNRHQGMMKIGQTEIEATGTEQLMPNCEALVKAAQKRINEQTGTAGVLYELQYVELAHFSKESTIYNINDTEVHNVLINSGYKRAIFSDLTISPKEWFIVNNLEIVKKAIKAAKENKISLDLSDHQRTDQTKKIIIKFREEQAKAIEKTTKQFALGKRMLWNAKMRFGKTLCALEVIKQQKYRRTLIITHRPAVRSGWFEDFNLLDFNENYFFGMGDRLRKAISKDSPYSEKIKNFKVLEEMASTGNLSYIYFASLQDLRGSKLIGGKHDKNEELFNTSWDLLIIDEAHEGTMAEHGKPVIDELQKQPNLRTLYLSGTPYNIMKDFTQDEIYTWDYVMEQAAKEKWYKEHPELENPYERLPRLEMHRYNLSEDFNNYGRDEDDYFNFAEFFRTDNFEKFVHEDDVKSFLRLLCKDDPSTGYPYSTSEFRYALSHTLWVLPTVASANSLERLLQADDSPLKEYFIINVAGDNVDNQDNLDAVTKVARGIKDHEKTITLTINSGRMTVGVSVPEWSGVFMLSGAATTKASSYLQTIFRAQTPTRRGVYPFKTVCHAFDFAPDRVLEIVNEVAEQHSKAYQPQLTHSNAVENTLHFLPIIAHDMSREEPLDTIEFMGMVGNAYSEHILRRGFADKRLFVDLDQLTPEQYKIIGEFGLKMKKSGHLFNDKEASDASVELSHTGLDSNSKGKPKEKTVKSKTSTKDQTKPPKGKKKESPGTQALKVLLEIYTRLPMMIFGCDISDEDITLQHLVDSIDKESWEVFMPKGIGKKEMQILIDMKIVQENRFVSAALMVRNNTRFADTLPVTQRVSFIASQIGTFRFPDKETVLTPWNTVNMHLSDMIGGWSFFDEDNKAPLAEPRFVNKQDITDSVFKQDGKILEINSKSGLYPLYVTYSLFRWRKEHPLIGDPKDENELWQEIVANNIYVLCMSDMAAKITKRALLGYKQELNHIQPYLKNRDIIKDLKNDKEAVVRRLHGANNFWHNNYKIMTFDTILGNPPYQLMDGGSGASATPIYNRFVDLAKSLNPSKISMIMPAKWYTDGKGLGTFRETMLNDKQILKLVDFTDSRDCFDKVDIAGGICYFLWKKGYYGQCIFTNIHQGKKNTSLRYLNEGEGFLRHQEAKSIISKIQNQSLIFYNSRVSAQKPFGLRTYVTPLEKGDLILKYNKGYGPYDSSLISVGKNMIPKWKVIMSYLTAEHAGQTDKEGRKKILSSLDILKPNEICTETYLVVDSFESEKDAKALMAYLKTRFARFLIAQLAATQHLSKEKFTFLPIQNFSDKENIDWTVEVAEIDKQLYKKYNLSSDEISFIESMIRPML